MKGPYAAQYGAPYLMAHRADLHRLLCELVPAESVQLGAQCTGVSSAGRGASATFADGSQIEADVIVGAETASTRPCAKVCFGVQPVRFTQQMAWRCIGPIESVPIQVGIGRDEMSAGYGPTAM